MNLLTSSSRKSSNSISESHSRRVSLASCSRDSHRDSVSNTLHKFHWIEINDKKIKDGRLFIESNAEFQVLSASNPDVDCPKVLEIKASSIFSLLKISKETVLFLDAAPSELKDSWANDGCIFNYLDASGQVKLHLLRTMYSRKLFNILVQVGHDGIGQKAGVAEHSIIEIYPDWDRNDLFKLEIETVQSWIEKADLVIFLSDNINLFTESVKILGAKTKFGLRYEDGGSLGFVLVSSNPCDPCDPCNPCQLDPLCTVRVNCDKSAFLSYLITPMIAMEGSKEMERKCSALEHRNYFRNILSQEHQNDKKNNHGILFSNLRYI